MVTDSRVFFWKGGTSRGVSNLNSPLQLAVVFFGMREGLKIFLKFSVANLNVVVL
jgi:hypothetical protein